MTTAHGPQDFEFLVLGPLVARRAGSEIPVRGGLARALLVLLAVNTESPIRTGELVDALWDGEPPSSARAALQMHVAALRRALGPDAPLRTEAGGYALQVPPAQVDATRFVRDVAHGRDLLEAGDAGAAADVLRRALALWRGDPLADIADLSVARGEVERLHELRFVALERRIDADLKCGRHAEIVGELRVLLHEEPYRERLHALLMLSLYRSGRQAEALEHYRNVRSRLVEDLGLEPGPGLQGLQEAILRQDPALATAPVVVADHGRTEENRPDREQIAMPQPLVRRRLLEFVGRSLEMARLRAAFERACADGLEIVACTGEAGIGKTRLVSEFAREAHAAEAIVLYGRCEPEALVPHEPWVEALGHYVDAVDEVTLRRRFGDIAPELARMLPNFAVALDPGARGAADEPDTERYRLFDAVAAMLRVISSDRALIVILEDLHWADNPTALLLRHAVHRVSESRILLVLTYRDVELARGHPLTHALADIRRDVPIEMIVLEGLKEEEVAVLVEAQRGRDDDFARALCVETAGNAFFIGEVIRNAPANGQAEVIVPDSVRQVIASRLGRLSQDVERILMAAAVIGHRFDATVLRQTAEVDPDAMVDALDQALAARLITEEGEQVGRWAFSHALTRASLYEHQSRTRRVRQHLRVAHALAGDDDRAPGRSAEIAHHYRQAVDVGGWEPVLRYSLQASNHALDQLAYEEAARHMRRALEAHDEMGVGDPALQTDLNIRLGEAEQAAGDKDAARRAFAAAVDAARRRDDAEGLARAALGLAGPTFQSFGQVDRDAIERLREALAALPEGDGLLRARVLARLAIALYFAEARERAQALTATAVWMARRLEDPAALAETLEARLWALWNRDGVDERLTVASELLEMGERTNRVDLIALGRRWRVFTLLELGRMVEADRERREHAAAAEQLGQTYERMYATTFATSHALYRGRWNEAEQGAARLAAIEQRRAGADAHQFVGALGVTLALERHELGTLEPALRVFTERYPAIRAWDCGVAMALAHGGRDREARVIVDELMADDCRAVPNDAMWILCLTAIAIAVEKLGDRDHVPTLYRLLSPYADRVVVLGAGAAMWGPVSYHLGVLAWRSGEALRARDHLRMAEAFCDATGGVTWAGRAHRALEALGA